MKKTIAVTRSGSPLFIGSQASARGEMDTLPMLTRLAEERDDINVVYFGPIAKRSDSKSIDGVHVIEVDTSPVDGSSSAAEIHEAFRPALNALQATEPVCIIEMPGMPPTWSWPDNPAWAGVHDWCVKYALHDSYMNHHLDVPRFLVVTDPKTYPRNLEMWSCWQNTIPKAVLSQEQRVFPKTGYDIKYNVHTAYAACEFWLTRGMEFRGLQDKEYDVVIAANAHLKEHRLPKGRTDLWAEILMEAPLESTRVCGAGWDQHCLYEKLREMFVGVLPTFEHVMAFIAAGDSGPMIPQWPGFNSTKPRLYALAGTVPNLFGDGSHPMTYDRDERILPLNHPSRWVTGQDCVIDDYTGLLEEVLEKTTPNFSRLDALIDAALENRITYPSPEWLSMFGGYVRS